MPPDLAAAYGDGLIRCSSQLEGGGGGQGSGQMARQESYQYGGVPSAMDQAAALSMFQQQGGPQEAFGAFAANGEPGRYAAELGGRHSGQLPGSYRPDALASHPSYNQLLRQASSGGGAYPTYGDLHAQGSGHLGNGYGQHNPPQQPNQAAGGFALGANDRQSMSSASSSMGCVQEHPGGIFSANNWQDAILSGGNSLREEECRSWGARSGSPHEDLPPRRPAPGRSLPARGRRRRMRSARARPPITAAAWALRTLSPPQSLVRLHAQGSTSLVAWATLALEDLYNSFKGFTSNTASTAISV